MAGARRRDFPGVNQPDRLQRGFSVLGADVQQDQLAVFQILQLQAGHGECLLRLKVDRAAAALDAHLSVQGCGEAYPHVLINKHNPLLPDVQRDRQWNALPFHELHGLNGAGSQQREA
ncbi:Uncharacterised protein [Klebsiella pneumoniae]|nr:Uncharacterised protein [Klebsiella pneumoniae]